MLLTTCIDTLYSKHFKQLHTQLLDCHFLVINQLLTNYCFYQSYFITVFKNNYLIQMDPEENSVSSQSKKNYQEINLDYLERIKQKKKRSDQQRLLQQKKQQQKRQRLKKKILAEASKNRQNVQKLQNEQRVTELSKTGQRKRKTFQSLPKIQQSDSKQVDEQSKKDHRQRYKSFLKNLNQTVKSKKEIEEQQKKKKEQKYAKLKQQLGFNNVQSKLSYKKPKTGDELARSHSADKFQSLMDGIVAQMPKTNKNFKRKNEQYIQRLKQRRQLEQQAKEEEKNRKQKLKDKLKQFVMVTVKKNVLDGVYDEQIVEKIEKKKSKKQKLKQKDNLQDQQDQDQQGEEESEEEQDDDETKKIRKLRSFPYITDLNEWKKKNRIETTDKVYIITGGYHDLKKALKERGWYQNPDRNSPCFDLKYTLQGRQIDYDHLLDSQMVNHYQKAGCITTKVGLSKSLRSMKYIKDISQDNFFPKCFDLGDQDDYVGFETNFKICKAMSILKIYSSFIHDINVSPQARQKNKQLIQDLKMRTEVALSVCKKNIQDIDDIIDKKKVVKVVTDKQWQILAQDQLNQQGLAKKKHEQWLKSIDCKYNQETKVKKPKKKKEDGKNESQENKQQTNEQQQQIELQNQLAKQVDELLQEYKKRFPQYHIIGHNNIWILKPAGLSRGRGITCYNNLVQIQDHVKCKESLWIAQKYIENPLVILKRKFDIRQWVLVTDFNPLTIWLYDQCYIRFSAQDYDPKNVKNKFIHLTNNSIGAYHKNFGSSHIKGNMFFQEQFATYLQQKQGKDIFGDHIRPQIKQIVKNSMMCAMEFVQNRKNTHQLFGYDFMVDQNYKVWLIEINSSPSMDYSTHITTKLVKQCLSDVAKVIVDHNFAPKKQKKTIDTGKFKKIYKGIQIPQKPISTGLNLCLEGIPMKKPKRNTVKVTNFSLQK